MRQSFSTGNSRSWDASVLGKKAQDSSACPYCLHFPFLPIFYWTSSSKLLQIILVGQPEIEAKLDSKELRQLKQRIVLRSTIGYLTEEESRRYIDYRLRLAGSSSSKVFTPEALSLICRYSRGIPLSINIQCNKAFGIGYRLSRKRIDPSIVKKVNRDCYEKIWDSMKNKVKADIFWSVQSPAHITLARI